MTHSERSLKNQQRNKCNVDKCRTEGLIFIKYVIEIYVFILHDTMTHSESSLKNQQRHECNVDNCRKGGFGSIKYVIERYAE